MNRVATLEMSATIRAVHGGEDVSRLRAELAKVLPESQLEELPRTQDD